GQGHVDDGPAGAGEVAVDVDTLAGENLRVRVRVDVVTDAQEDRALRCVHQAMDQRFRCVLEEEHRPRREQAEVLALPGAFAYREAGGAAGRVAAAGAERLDQDDLGVTGGLGQVNAPGRPRAGGPVRIGLRVDLEVVIAVRLRVRDIAAGRAADVA